MYYIKRNRANSKSLNTLRKDKALYKLARSKFQ